MWQTAVYRQEICEPFSANDRNAVFPLTRTWVRQSGTLSEQIDFICVDALTNEYQYTLYDSSGIATETGSVSISANATPYPTIDLTPSVGSTSHLGIYNILSDTMQIAWETTRPDSLDNASVYTTTAD